MAQKLSRSKRKNLGITVRPKDGGWINYMIRREGLTQADIARRAGVSRTLVTHVLAGRKNSERVKVALADALGCTWEQLIGRARRSA